MRTALLIPFVSGNKLPCQRPAKRNSSDQPNQLHWLNDLPRKLKLSSARSAVADACCDGRPYSSATSQCCFRRVIPIDQTCCITGESIDRGLTCPCAPTSRWLTVELDRLVTMGKALDKVENVIDAAVEVTAKNSQKIQGDINRHDSDASDLGRELCNILELSPDDPECGDIEQRILENRPEESRRRSRPRRKVTVHEESVHLYDYEDYGHVAQYESEYESEYPEQRHINYNSHRLNDIGRIDYEEEPEDEATEYAQVKSLVHQRKTLRDLISSSSSDLAIIRDTIDTLKYMRSVVYSIQVPVKELEVVVDSSFEFKGDESVVDCSIEEWMKNSALYLDEFKSLEGRVHDLHSSIEDKALLNGTEEWILAKFSELTFWHERHNRLYRIYTEDLEGDLYYEEYLN